MNKVSLIGRLTKDIELRQTSQSQVARFTLAVDRLKKEQGSDFITCKVWGKRAEIMQKYVKKGHKVGITGRIETGSYQKDGITHYTTEVVVEDFDFLEPRHDEQARQEPPKEEHAQKQEEHQETLPDGFEYSDDDLPF